MLFCYPLLKYGNTIYKKSNTNTFPYAHVKSELAEVFWRGFVLVLSEKFGNA